MNDEDKTFRLKHRGSKIFSVTVQTLLALYMLIASVVRFKAYLKGGVVDWQNSWWVPAIFFVLAVIFIIDTLQDIFLQLTISKEGVWYYRLGSKRFISWKQIECIGVTRTYLTGKKQYGFILKPESNQEKRTLLGNKQKDLVIPLSIFVDRWLGSELLNEVKRLKPHLPVL